MARILESELVRKRTLRLFEQYQAEVVRQSQRSQWLEENKEVLEAYNRRIAREHAGKLYVGCACAPCFLNAKRNYFVTRFGAQAHPT